MRCALISELGRPPEVGEAPEPTGALLEVVAAPLNPLDRAVANGSFYGGHPPLPYVPGCECVGRDVDGRLVWTFSGGLGLGRNGTLAERCEPGAVVAAVPDGADPAIAAALGIAGLAGWLPLAWRAPVRPDDRVLVLGATGTVGQVAVQAAKLLGAAHVIAAGRDETRLAGLRELGADETAALDGDWGEPTLVVDPLCGEPLERAVAVAAPGARIVQLGQSAAPAATLPSAAIRGKQLELLGFSNFGTAPEVLAEHYRRLVEHAVRGELTVDVERIGLDDVAAAWSVRGKPVVCF